MSEEQNFETVEPSFLKRSIEDIVADAQKIDFGKVGDEVLKWVIVNVENFIDNQTKIFKLDLVLDNVKGMEETRKLQDLYRAIPDDNETDEKVLEKAQECRIILNEVTAKAFGYIKESRSLLEQLFDRMIFYYEKIIPSPENKKRAMEIDCELRNLINQKEEAKTDEDKREIQGQIVVKIKEGESLVQFEKFVGQVSITNFEYEAFSVGVRIVEGSKPEDEENEENKEKKILKSYVIPEGFVLWIEISFKHKQRQTAMF